MKYSSTHTKKPKNVQALYEKLKSFGASIGLKQFAIDLDAKKACVANNKRVVELAQDSVESGGNLTEFKKI